MLKSRRAFRLLTNRLGKQMDVAKKKSAIGFNSLCVWMSSVFNKVTGYDQITELESRVTVSERVFENTTQSLRELNTEYLVMII